MISAEYLKAIIDYVGDPVFAKDREHRFIYTNDAASEMFGRSQEELLGRTDYEFFPKEQADVFRTHDERVFETGLEDINEEQITGGDGKVRTIVTKKRLYVDGEGNKFIVGVIRDITDRKAAEDALRSTTLQLSEAMDMAKMAYWEVDEKTDEFVFNDAFYALLGTTAAQEGGYGMAKGEYLKRFVHPGDLQRLLNEIEENRSRSCRAANAVEEYEHRALRRDGSIIHILDRNRVIMDNLGTVVKTVGVNQDITERKEAEEDLRRREKRENVLGRIKGVFLTIPDQDMYGEVLAVVLQAFRSEFGMFGFVGDNGNLIVPSMTGNPWDQCKIPEKSIVFPADSWGSSLFGRVIKEQKVFCSSGSFHTPAGHIGIEHFLGAPIVFGGRSIGLLAVANASGGYSLEEKILLQDIASDISPILNARLQRDRHEKERMQAEDFLRTSRLQLADAMVLGRMAYWEVDLDTQEFVFNDPFYELLHTSAEAEGGYRMAVEEYARRFVHPGDLEDFFANHKKNVQRMAEEDFFQFEHRTLGRNKRVIHILSRTRVVRDGAGNIVRVYGSNQDITELRRAEKSLLTSQRRLAEAMDIARLAYWEADLENEVFTFNDALYDLLGTTAEKEGGYTISLDSYVRKFIHPDEIPGIMALVKELRSNNYASRYIQREIRHVRGDGQVRYFLTRLNVLRDPSRQRTKIFGTNQDITEAKHVQEALRLSEEKYRTIVETSILGVFVVQDNQYRFVNKGFCEIHGYTREEILNGMSPAALVHPDHRSQIQVVKEVLDSGAERIERDHVIVRKDGSTGYIKVFCHAIEYGGRTAYLGSIVDITKERTLESQLHHAQKMEAIGLLAGGIAHDFNNILTAIMGYGTLLMEKLPKDDPLLADVEIILSSANRATQLTSGLLAFSRKQMIQPVTIDLKASIADVEKLLARLLTEDIELRITHEAGPIHVFGDHGQIEQVLINLATNSRDAMAQGGLLSIDTKTVRLTEGTPELRNGMAPGRYALITVSDTGCGMSKEMTERIFDPFFTTKEIGKGTGLGLSIAYGVVAQHRGEISVTSELGAGTTFRIYLPLSDAPLKKERPVATERPQGGDETIMVVEDDRVTRTLTVEVLKRYGYSILEAFDGDDAVRKFKEQRDKIDLVILDVIMPKKNGKEALEKMKAMRANLKALFVSGYTADIMEEKGFITQDINFLPKPIMPRKLAAKVRELLDGQG